MKRMISEKLKVRPGAQNPALGLYLGEEYVYYLISTIAGTLDQVIVCDAKTGKMIPGVNLAGFEVVK